MIAPVSPQCVPQPSNPLKSFNWSKLPECKVQGTIWTDLDDSKLYKQLDLAEVDRLFSAYQKNGIMVRILLCFVFKFFIDNTKLSGTKKLEFKYWSISINISDLFPHSFS